MSAVGEVQRRRSWSLLRPSAARAADDRGSRVAPLLTGDLGGSRDLRLRILLLAIWLPASLFLAFHHVHWGDEVRAFSIALQGETVADMLRGLHGEGHPALWYLLLRGAHWLVPVREVLPGAAMLVALGAMAVFALRAPFRPLTLALIMFGGLALFEYAVVARNYGIGMLLLFLIAWAWPHKRDRSVWIGGLLFLLCNTSVVGTLFAGALVGMWLIEIVSEEGLRPHRKYRAWALNAVVASVGAALCFLTVYPPVNDAAPVQHEGGITLGTIAAAVASPDTTFLTLMPFQLLGPAFAGALLVLLLLGSLLGLARAPAALSAGLAGMLLYGLLHNLIYPGSFRHQGLFLMFLIALYWIAARGHGGAWPARIAPSAKVLRFASTMGGAAFQLLLAVQLLHSVANVSAALQGVPYSQAKDVAAVLERQGLSDAVLLADSDPVLEALAYYTPAATFILRDQRFGNVVRLTRQSRRDLSVDDLFNQARQLSRETRRPAVILTQHPLDPAAPPRRVQHMFGAATYDVDPDQIRRFLAATRKIASREPTITAESYDVYLVLD
jgi:hypothetical protein